MFGHFSVVYVDHSFAEGIHNLEDIVSLLRALGFTIQADKLLLISTQTLAFCNRLTKYDT